MSLHGYIYLLDRQPFLAEPLSFAAPPFSRCVTAATEVVMIGGGGRKTGVGARRLSTDMDRNTLRGLGEFETVVGDIILDVTASGVVAAAAKFSTATVDDGLDGDMTLVGASSCPLSDVIGVCVEDGSAVIVCCAVAETTGMVVAVFDTWLLDVGCVVILCAVVGH